jgi:hypothetical protein
MIKKLITSVKNNLLNIPGWKTNRKIIVIESDDWGTIRTPSKAILESIQSQFKIEYNPYVIYDSLETEDDLNALFETLKSIKNNSGQHPIFTANSIMANPDFEKIRKSNFSEYHYELVTDTFKRQPNTQNCVSLWKNGMSENIFKPQFHGREHLNVALWMKLLQTDKLTKAMFDFGFWGVLANGPTDFLHKNSMAGCNYSSETELTFVENSLTTGLAHFKSILGYNSKSFIANNYIWDSKIENILHDNGVLYIQGQAFQLFPQNNRMLTGKTGKRNYIGDFNANKQIYLTRNCAFETCQDRNFNDSITSCLSELDTAFLWNKPVIISTHRVNYMGTISEKNRKDGLEKLTLLLKSILKKYPDVEFMTSDQLGDLILSEKII